MHKDGSSLVMNGNRNRARIQVLRAVKMISAKVQSSLANCFRSM